MCVLAKQLKSDFIIFGRYIAFYNVILFIMETIKIFYLLNMFLLVIPDVSVGIKLNGKEILNGGSVLGRKKDRVVLSCSIYAVPPPNVTWSRDNVTIGTYHHVNGAIEKSSNTDNFLYELKTKALETKIGISVTLDFTLDADYTFASYHCDAENEVGSNRKTVKIKHVQKR